MDRGVGQVFVDERRALRDTLAEAGPDAPTLISRWSTANLAAHVVATEQMWGVPSFLGRSVVARYGLRLNTPLSPVYALDIRRFGRRGFTWAVDRLAAAPPALLRHPAVAPVSLFEVFVHHEDVRRANGLPDREEPDLLPVLRFLLLYQRRQVRRLGLRVVHPGGEESLGTTGEGVVLRGPVGEAVLWLAGRRDVARVELDGPAAVLRQLDDVTLSV